MRINVLMSGNKNVYEGICLCVLSILKHTASPVTLYIMTMRLPDTSEEITKEQADKLRRVMKDLRSDSELVYIDVTDDYQSTLAASPNKKPACTPFTLVRLFVQRHITDCDRILYLDADTMTTAPLEEIANIDISEYEMAVSLDRLGKFWISKDYFNAGVLYINMQAVRESNLFERAIDLLMEKKYVLADQSALNELCERKLYLPSRFNEQREIKPDTVIKHFNKFINWFPLIYPVNIKQWQRDKVHKKLKIFEFDDIYQQYDEYFGKDLKEND